MAKKRIDDPLSEWTESDWAEAYDLLYQGAMQSGAMIPAFPSYLKGHQRHEEFMREESAKKITKEAIKSEISRLQGMLDAMEEDERNNTPHKQLNLFDR